VRALVMRGGIFLILLGLIGCGGSVKDNGGPAPCASLGACECWAASDRCSMTTESCWCASACDPNISCICGGGKFLSCQDKQPPTPTCDCYMCGCGLEVPPESH